MRCTLPYGLTPTTVTRSRPGTGSTLDTSCSRKECIPWPEQFSDERAAPSSRMVREQAMRIAEIPGGISTVARDFAIIRSGRGGPGLTMAGSRVKSNIRRRHWVHEVDACAEIRFCEPIQGDRMKLETIKWRLKTLLSRLWLPRIIGSLTQPSSVFWRSNRLPSEENQEYRLCLDQTLLRLSYII